ncbi:MAG: hypothetical protein ACRDUV_18850 [Pseudonocardiaceae bacterium]
MTVAPGEDSIPIRYRDAFGVLRETKLTMENDLALPGGALPSRVVTDGAGRRLVQKWVPRHAGAVTPSLYNCLDAEVRAGTRFRQVYDGRFPDELPELYGYNVDLWEPFVLFVEYRGQPAAGSGLPEVAAMQPYRAQVALLRALKFAATADIVHGRVAIEALRWDGVTVQLVDFEHAVRAGETRLAAGPAAAALPEQFAGTGVADVRDDIWRAGFVLRQLTLGTLMTDQPADTSTDPPALRHLLSGVFAPTPEQRPHAAELLARLGADDPVATAPDLNDELMSGRRLFESKLAEKHVRGSPAPVKRSPAKGRLASAHFSVLRVLGIGLALAMLVLVIVYLVIS